MVQLVIAFVLLALLYFVLLYAGARLMAAFNLLPKDWFQNSAARSRLQAEGILNASTNILSPPAAFDNTFFKNANGQPSKYPFTSQARKSDIPATLLFVIRGRLLSGQMSGTDSQKANIPASIKFHPAALLPIASKNSAFAKTTNGRLTWQS
jgi:hypothetical protein